MGQKTSISMRSLHAWASDAFEIDEPPSLLFLFANGDMQELHAWAAGEPVVASEGVSPAVKHLQVHRIHMVGS